MSLTLSGPLAACADYRLRGEKHTHLFNAGFRATEPHKETKARSDGGPRELCPLGEEQRLVERRTDKGRGDRGAARGLAAQPPSAPSAPGTRLLLPSVSGAPLT